MKVNMKNKTNRYLMVIFVLMFILCGCLFLLLMKYMMNSGKKTAAEISGFYMDRMSTQIIKHFDTTVEIKLAQVESIVKTVPPEGQVQGRKLIQAMAVSGAARDFQFLCLLSEEGEVQLIFGEEVEIADEEPFLDSLKAGEKKIAVANIPSTDTTLVLLGVPCAYDMENGGKSIAMVAGIDVDYVNNTLFLDNPGVETYSHIIRRNGDFVIKSGTAVLNNYYDRLQNIVLESDEQGADYYMEKVHESIDNKTLSTFIMSTNEGIKCVYVAPLPYSEWYLITTMSYDAMDGIIRKLDYNSLRAFLMAIIMMFTIFIVVFIMYHRITRFQMIEIDKARSEAIRANKAKSEFLSNMSHDIRTPMNAIVGMTAIATANIDDRQQLMNCLKKITLSSRHLLGLINDILDMSKIESGKMTLNPDMVSLREAMDSIVTIIQPQIKSKNQVFDVFISNILAENVYCDGVRLNQVLINFLSNAYKFTPEGGEIHVYLSQEESPRGDDFVRVHFRVKDSGMGMTPEFQKKIFESFSREDSTRVHKTEGTGLGMTISKYIVDAMEGTIEVHSEVGKGTEFHVILDLEKATVKEEDMVLPSWNMLLVDDDEQLCRETAEKLEELTIHCDWAVDGRTAIRMMEEHHNRQDAYQIVLLDWRMEGMNGIETARELRHKFGDEMPILIISAYDWSDIEEEAREAGISGFISKPLFKSTLYHGLLQYMGSSQEKEEVQKAPSKDFSGVRILLAEDNDINYEIANELLTAIGIEIEWAQNGQICVDMFEKSDKGYYDAILMDIRMPIMSGYEAARKIRSLTRQDAGLPIIAMTADAFSEDVKKCKECGMNDHTSKPIDMDILTRLLAKYLHR
jgi:Signal transduction histidine kinase